jgi:hypothetical protein
MNYMGKVEAKFKCSGFCELQPIYYFSDVNAGAPEKRCLEAFVDEVLFDVTGKYGTALIIVGFFMLIG